MLQLETATTALLKWLDVHNAYMQFEKVQF